MSSAPHACRTSMHCCTALQPCVPLSHVRCLSPRPLASPRNGPAHRIGCTHALATEAAATASPGRERRARCTAPRAYPRPRFRAARHVSPPRHATRGRAQPLRRCLIRRTFCVHLARQQLLAAGGVTRCWSAYRFSCWLSPTDTAATVALPACLVRA